MFYGNISLLYFWYDQYSTTPKKFGGKEKVYFDYNIPLNPVKNKTFNAFTEKGVYVKINITMTVFDTKQEFI